MNKKLIAVAVASTLTAPVVYAESHEGITVYGRVNNAVSFVDTGEAGSSNRVDVTSVSSRFGLKGSADLGNGMTAFGRYEFSTDTDNENPPGINDLRLGFVGISGGFGSFAIGQQWSAFFDTFGTLISPTYSLGYFLYSSFAEGPFRTSNTIKYSNSFGPVYLEADVRLNDSEEGNAVAEKLNGNGFGIGATINPTDNIGIYLAVDSEENAPDADTGVANEDTDRAGIGFKVGFGNGMAFSYGHMETETGSNTKELDQIYFSSGLWEKGSLLVGFGQGSETNRTNDPDSWFLGIYHRMGGGLRLYLESTGVDFGNGGTESDLTVTLLGARIDF